MQVQPNKNARFYPYLQSNLPLFRQVLNDSCVAQHRFSAGELLLTQGQKVDHLYVVSVGRVSMNITVASGKRFQLGEVQCDDHIFGEMEFFTQVLCQWNVVAEEDIDVAVISAARLAQAMLHSPEITMFFASALAEDYQDSLDIYTQRLLWPIMYNIAYDLWIRHQSDVALGGFERIDSEAERFGTTSRVYRRAVKALLDRGLVVKHGHHLSIGDPSKLKAFLDDKIYSD
ncbi:Crp/Fnr family transcriptional regulator [Vibrio gazogenes]|uniref:Crp/Fnr family transcriptional regulator n=1 Tax=Vibrio gazogenes TaxID=687 RepID=A0A1Z2SJI6_VIBGA|nr:Crp/Fnr family transcriptional regulator [Vibrio gazogenes]ASA57257.1 Crp/Fnr family transcriptional regulator [Vibrio gazogenes]